MSGCVVALRLSGPASARQWSSSTAPQRKYFLYRFFATGGSSKLSTGRFVPRGQRKRTLAEADKKRIQKALEKKDEAPRKTEMWYDDKEKLWAYRKAKWGTALQRAAPLMVIGCLLSYSPEANDFFYRYLCPLQVEMLYGASMLPTVHPYGDTWLHTTPLWDTLRRPYHALKSMVTGKPSLLYKKGEIIIWRDPKQNNRRACKRIIGVEGEYVLRFGEYVDYYSHRPDLGIRWESLMARGLDPSCPWDEDKPFIPGQKDDLDRTLMVPKGHVWIEGDNPLVCVDSRHYGPVPVELVEGKLIWRLFPLLRHVNIRKYDQRLRQEPAVRPPPLNLEKPKQRGEEDILATYYNLYRLPKDNKENPLPEMQDGEYSQSQK